MPSRKGWKTIGFEIPEYIKDKLGRPVEAFKELSLIITTMAYNTSAEDWDKLKKKYAKGYMLLKVMP